MHALIVQVQLLLLLALLPLSQSFTYFHKTECVHRDRCCSSTASSSPQVQCGEGHVPCDRPCDRECGINNWRQTINRVSSEITVGWGTSQLGEHPWQGALLEQKYAHSSLQYLGGVSLIYPRWALTTATSVCGKISCRTFVRFGDVNLNRTDHLYNYFQTDIEQIISHPEFNSRTLSYNVALLRLTNPVPIGRYISPVCLPSGGNKKVSDKCTVSGWGKTLFNSMFYSAELRAVNLELIDRHTCERKMRRYNWTFQLHPSEMCAGGQRGHDACTGDEGSPLVCHINGRHTQVGLVSKGVKCGEDKPGVYAKVPECWVKQTIDSYQHRRFNQQSVEFPST